MSRSRTAALALGAAWTVVFASLVGGPGTAVAAPVVHPPAFTAWAHPNFTTPVRRHPHVRAHAVARMHLETEGGAPEIYPILARFRDARGHEWVRVAVPKRPMGITGWVRSWALGPTVKTDMLLVVDRATLRATLRDRGRTIWSARVGVGARATPTPAGQFWVREKLRDTFGGTSYGPRAFGTSGYSVLSDWPGGGVIGIHGTDQPRLIPGRPSHGCIRLRNADVLRLYALMPVGTPVHVR